MLRDYQVSEPDPIALARTFGIALTDVGVRLGVTGDYARKMARQHRHARRVRQAVLEIALEREHVRQEPALYRIGASPL